MVQITLMGRDFEVAPYKIGALRQAAPIIERINGAIGGLTTLTGGIEVAGDMAAFLAIGLTKVDPAMTPEALEEQLGFEDIPALQIAFRAVLQASGFKSGEAPAPSGEAAPEAASKKASATSSSSSSQPA